MSGREARVDKPGAGWKMAGMRVRRGWVLLSVMLAAVAAVSGCGRRQVLPPAKPVAERADGVIELRLVTYNVRYEGETETGFKRWEERVRGMVKGLVDMNPDVFAVQEARHGQVADLWASLPDFDFQGVGRDDGVTGGEYTGIFFRRDRFAADAGDAGTFWLSDTPEAPGSKSWGNEIPRIATWVRLVDRATGRGFYVFGTHWDHRNQTSRVKAARLMAERIDSRRHPEEPVVLMGDFNAVESNPAVGHLLGNADRGAPWKNALANAWGTLHPGENERTTLHLWRGNRGAIGYVVDHILVSRGAKLLEAEIVPGREPYPSDHFPVFARIAFPSTRKP